MAIFLLFLLVVPVIVAVSFFILFLKNVIALVLAIVSFVTCRTRADCASSRACGNTTGMG